MKCPFGNYDCVDPGQPTDCEVNFLCLFRTEGEREEFEKQPDKFLVTLSDGREYKFKNIIQVKYLITDLPSDITYTISTSDVKYILEMIQHFGGQSS
ncbi:MAG: hypothetical protein ACRC06_06205 [Waterburya sp.]